MGTKKRSSNYPKQKRFLKNFSPYSFKELIYWFWKNISLKKKNPGKIHYLPKKYQFNQIEQEIKIGFLGDLMDTFGKEVEFSSEIKNFFSDCEVLVANFEGTLWDGDLESPMDQKIPLSTVNALKTLKKPGNIYLCLANNHSGDFKNNIYKDSYNFLEEQGFNCFGTINSPYINLNDRILIYGATRWSNKLRGFDRLAKTQEIIEKMNKMDNTSANISKGLNHPFWILYPHWGYELELFPREETIKNAKKYLKMFDCIIGHHSHTPQPITKINDKMVAFSLGDTCFRSTSPIMKRYCYGQMLKLTVGALVKGKKAAITLQMGEIEWSFIQSTFPEDEENKVIIKPIENYPLISKKLRKYLP